MAISRVYLLLMAASITGQRLTEIVCEAGDRTLVEAKLVCDAASVAPGDTFTVGLLLDIEEGWHVYWMNPGDSGYATSLKLVASAGCEVGPIRWPIPQRFEYEGMVTYGYEKRVLLTATVRVPHDAKAGSDIELRAEAAWLSCKVECVPGEAKLRASVKVGSHSAALHDEIFHAWRERYPLEAAEAEAAVQTPPDASVGRVVLQWSRPVKDIQVFPATSEAAELSDIEAQHKGQTTTITYTPAVYDAAKLPDGKTMLLVTYEDEQGLRRGVWVTARAL